MNWVHELLIQLKENWKLKLLSLFLAILLWLYLRHPFQ